MRSLSLLALACLLLHSTDAKKKSYWENVASDIYEHASEATGKLSKASADALKHVIHSTDAKKKKEESYWAHVASDLYKHTSEATGKLSKASADALKHVNSAIDTDQIARVASNAYASAATVAGTVGQKAVEVSSAAYETVNAAIESGEVSRAASDAYNSAAEAARQLGQKAAEVSSAAFTHVNAAVEDGSWKSRASQAASDAAAAASQAADALARGLREAAKGRSEGEAWSSYLKRVAPVFAYGGDESDGQEAMTDGIERENAPEGATNEQPVTKIKKEQHLEEYVFFWRALNGTTWSQSLSDFAQRFYYEKDENEKRAANTGYAAAINTLVGSFRQINLRGRGAIYELMSGFGWGMHQVNTAGAKAIYKPSLFGSTLGHFGSMFWYGSVLAEGVNVVNAAAKDLDEGTSVNTVRASSKAAASWTAAAVGASAGATLCSVVPVFGPIVGGLAGGIAGAYSGEIAGEAAANAYADAFNREKN